MYKNNSYSRKELYDAFKDKINEDNKYDTVDVERMINDLVAVDDFDFFEKAYERLQSFIPKSYALNKMSDEDIEKKLNDAGFEAPEIKYAIDQYHLAEGKA